LNNNIIIKYASLDRD